MTLRIALFVTAVLIGIPSYADACLKGGTGLCEYDKKSPQKKAETRLEGFEFQEEDGRREEEARKWADRTTVTFEPGVGPNKSRFPCTVALRDLVRSEHLCTEAAKLLEEATNTSVHPKGMQLGAGPKSSAPVDPKKINRDRKGDGKQ